MIHGSITPPVSHRGSFGASVPELEPYHRLIALQKEIVCLAEQNERTRSACQSMLNQVAARGLKPKHKRSTLRLKLNTLLRKLPRSMARFNRFNLTSTMIKEQATC